jgi:hypothetical protein
VVGLKVLVGCPAYDGRIYTPMVRSLFQAAELFNCKNRASNTEWKLHFHFLEGCALIQKARNHIVSDFLNSNCDALLFLDSDIWFQGEDILTLANWIHGGYRTVLGMYPAKGIKPKFYMELETLPMEDGQRKAVTRPLHAGEVLIKMKAFPMGFCMIHRSVFETLKPMVSDYPVVNYLTGRDERHKAFFQVPMDKGTMYGEDIFFSKLMHSRGLGGWADTSIKLKHLGVFPYEHNFLDYIQGRDSENGTGIDSRPSQAASR